jgi:hypothetical protein
MLCSLTAVAALPLLVSFAQETRPVLRETLLDPAPFAWMQEGTWRAWVEELEPTERERLSAARRIPWQVVRDDGRGEPQVVLASNDPSRRTSWLRPRHMTIDGRGVVYVVSETRARLFIAEAPGQPLVEHELPSTSVLDVVHVEPEGLLRASAGYREPRALWWSALGPSGYLEARPMPPVEPPPRGVEPIFLRLGDELVWCSSDESLAALDLATGELRSIPYPAATAMRLERTVGSWLFARAVGDSERHVRNELRLTNVVSGASYSRPVSQGLVAWTPEGFFFPHWLHEPITGSRREIGEPLGVHGDLRRIDGGTVAFRGRKDARWRVLHLDATQPFDVPPLPGAAANVVAALDDVSEEGVRALGSTEFFQSLDGLTDVRSDEAVRLFERVLSSRAGTNAKMRAANRLGSCGTSAAHEALRAALAAETEPTVRVVVAGHLAGFMHPDDARAIEAAIPVESLPRGTRHGDTAVRVAEALAIIGDVGSCSYLEALYEHSPFDEVQRALELVRSAPEFRAALESARNP